MSLVKTFKAHVREARLGLYNFYTDLKNFDQTSWLLILITIVIGFVSFSIEIDLMPFFKHRLELNNKEAGELFGIRGLTALMVGIPCGIIIDKIGLKLSMMVGAFTYTIYAVLLALSDINIIDELTVSFGLTSSGILISNPVQLMMGRIIDDVIRLMGFNILYWSDNVGDMIASFVNPYMVSSSGLGQYELMFLVSAVLSFFCVIVIGLFLRERPIILELPDMAEPSTMVLSYKAKPIPESSDSSTDTAQLETDVTIPVQPLDSLSRIRPALNLLFSRELWRCLVLSVVFIPARMLFRDMTSLIPIYMQNVYGIDVNYSFAIGINPTMLVIFLLPYLGMTRKSPNIRMMLFLGPLVLALSPLPVIFTRGSSDESPVWLMVAILTIAEMLFSPLLNMFAVSLLPKGHEAVSMVLTGLPHVLGTMISGTMSGYLLDTFCPDPISLNYDHWAFYSCENIWVIAALRTLLTPLLWLVFQPFIMSKETGMICSSKEII